MYLKTIFKKIFRIKSIVSLLITIALLAKITLIFADIQIKSASKNYLYSDLIEIPYKKVGLVLGTAKFLQNGQVN